MVVQFIHNHLPKRFRESWPINRVINDVLIILIVILGWLVVDTQGAVKDSQNCIREYLVKQSESQQPRNNAVAETDEALAQAVATIPPLLDAILKASNAPDDIQMQADSFAAVRMTNGAFTKFNTKYNELERARKSFPLLPAPESLCKD